MDQQTFLQAHDVDSTVPSGDSLCLLVIQGNETCGDIVTLSDRISNGNRIRKTVIMTVHKPERDRTNTSKEQNKLTVRKPEIRNHNTNF